MKEWLSLSRRRQGDVWSGDLGQWKGVCPRQARALAGSPVASAWGAPSSLLAPLLCSAVTCASCSFGLQCEKKQRIDGPDFS